MLVKGANVGELQLARALSKRYKIRRAQPKVDSLETTIPWEVIEREARCAGLDIDQFIQAYEAEWLYNSFEGLIFRFVKR